MQFQWKGGNNLDPVPKRGTNDPRCQIREIIFEGFQIFHYRIFAEKLYQNNQYFCENPGIRSGLNRSTTGRSGLSRLSLSYHISCCSTPSWYKRGDRYQHVWPRIWTVAGGWAFSGNKIVLLPLLLMTCPLFCITMIGPEKQSLLLTLCAVIPAAVARIASIGSDLNTGSMALITYRTIVFHTGGLLFIFHGDWLLISL